ncbi:MAG TPA: hypothetical protein H9903_09135 [Candidatus Aquabacterium excrementipullorum]|nr:hypothetical protein [Candidatus Aquabacterium excrementipullorum]
MTTPLDVLAWVQSQNTNGQTLSSSQLAEFSSELNAQLASLSISVPGASTDAITLFYSGKVNSSTGSLDAWKVAENIGVSSGGEVITIGQTELGRFLNSDAFNQALDNALGNDSESLKAILNGQDGDGLQTIDGIWDIASNRLANAATGDVRTLTGFSDASKVFAQTELPALLDTPAVTSINGVDKRVFQAILDKTGSLEEVNKAVSASSYVLMDGMSAVTSTLSSSQIVVEGVDSTSLFEGTAYAGTILPADSANLIFKTDIIQNLTADGATTLGEGWRNLAIGEQAVALAEGGSQALGVLGIAASAYQIYTLVNQAEDAYIQGDTDRASKILADGTLSLAGGWAGGLAASSFASGFLAPLLPLGPVGDVAYIVLVAGAGILGAVFGEDAVKSLLQADTENATVATDGTWRTTTYANGVVIQQALGEVGNMSATPGSVLFGTSWIDYSTKVITPNADGTFTQVYFGGDGTVTQSFNMDGNLLQSRLIDANADGGSTTTVLGPNQVFESTTLVTLNSDGGTRAVTTFADGSTDTTVRQAPTIAEINSEQLGDITEYMTVSSNGSDTTFYNPVEGEASYEVIKNSAGQDTDDITRYTDGTSEADHWGQDAEGTPTFDARTFSATGQLLEDDNIDLQTYAISAVINTYASSTDTQPESTETVDYIHGYVKEDKVVDASGSDDIVYHPWDGAASEEIIKNAAGAETDDITLYTDGSSTTDHWGENAQGIPTFDAKTYSTTGQLLEEDSINLQTYAITAVTNTYGDGADASPDSTETINYINGHQTEDKITYADGSIDDTRYNPFPGLSIDETITNSVGQVTTEYQTITDGEHGTLYYFYTDGVGDPSYIADVYDAQDNLTEIVKVDNVNQLEAVITPTSDGGFEQSIYDESSDASAQQTWTEQDQTFSYDAGTATVSLVADTTYLRDGTVEQNTFNPDGSVSFTDTDAQGSQEWSEITGTKQLFSTDDGYEFLVTQSRTVHDDGTVDTISYTRNASDPVDSYQVDDILTDANGKSIAALTSDSTNGTFDVQYFQPDDATLSRIDEHYQATAVNGQQVLAETAETDYLAGNAGYVSYQFDPTQPNVTQEAVYNSQGVETLSGTITLNADQSMQETFTDLTGTESWTSGSITVSGNGQYEALTYVERDTSDGVASETYNFTDNGAGLTETDDVLTYTAAYGGITENDTFNANGSIGITLSNSSDLYNWSSASFVQQTDGSYSGTTYSDTGASLMDVNYQVANDNLTTHIYDDDGSWTNTDYMNFGTSQEQDSIMVYDSTLNKTSDELITFSGANSATITEGFYSGNYDYLANEAGSTISQTQFAVGSLDDPSWYSYSLQPVGGYNDLAYYDDLATQDYAGYSVNEYQDFSTPDFYDEPSSSFDLGGYDPLSEFSSYGDDFSYNYGGYDYGSSMDFGSFDSFGW